ncbi:MAG: amidohydrolase family protein [Saprospiraceae bacterium]|nr:amidohydrolase family protein [Saprospiraceae bacterium]
MVIDSHQHFWQYDPVDYDWIHSGTMHQLQRNYLPKDLLPLLNDNGVDGCVAVQARQVFDETRFLLDLASDHDFIKGVVGWIDLRSPQLEEDLNLLVEEKRLVGFRHILQEEPVGYALDPKFIEGVKVILDKGYSYDILVYAHQLTAVRQFVENFPEKRLVIDHIAKPNIRDGGIRKWREHIKHLSTFPNITCKLSGMVTEAHWMYWEYDDLVPYLDHILQCFGPTRCMYGSDWPVCTLAGSYAQVKEIIDEYLSSMSQTDRSAILGNTALDFYQLDVS